MYIPLGFAFGNNSSYNKAISECSELANRKLGFENSLISFFYSGFLCVGTPDNKLDSSLSLHRIPSEDTVVR